MLLSNLRTSRCVYLNPLINSKLFLIRFPSNVLISKYSTIYNGNKTKNQQDKLHKIIAKSRILSKLNKNPRFANYFNRLSDAGITFTLISFFTLHELTAIIPLFGLWYTFYHLDLPEQYQLPLYFTKILNQCGDVMEKLVGDNYDSNLDHNRLILAGATSYFVVKLLYPIRVLISLWGAPYMGRWISIPFRRLTSKYVKIDRSKKCKEFK